MNVKCFGWNIKQIVRKRVAAFLIKHVKIHENQSSLYKKTMKTTC